MARFVLTGAGIQAIKPLLFDLEQLPIEESELTSYLGTPVASFIKFLGGRYTTLAGELITYEELILETVILTINQSKNIITTPLQGRDGTIKEFISANDYQITISGALISQTNEFPEDLLTALKEIVNVPSALEVASDFLQIFEIDNLVITNFDFGQVRGFRNSINFTINAISDKEIDLVNV